MPKDPTKNRYLQVGIAWDSYTLGKLEADAKLHQMDDQVAKLVVLRLTEYYQLVDRGLIIPGVTAAMVQAPMQAAPVGSNGHGSTKGMTSSKQRGSIAPPAVPKQEQSTSTVAESDNADENADSALDFFKMDDDDE